MDYVYIVRGGGYIKIGRSTNVFRRVNTFNAGGVPFHVELVCFAEVKNAGALEIWAHDLFDEIRAQGEWFFEHDISDELLHEVLQAGIENFDEGAPLYKVDPMAKAKQINDQINEDKKQTLRMAKLAKDAKSLRARLKGD